MGLTGGRVLAIAAVLCLAGGCAADNHDRAQVEAATTVRSTSTTVDQSTTAGTTGTTVPIQGFGPAIALLMKGPAGKPGPIAESSAIATSGAGLVAVGTVRGDIAIFDGAGRLLAGVQHAHGDAVSGLAFLGRTTTLVSVGVDGVARTWSVVGAAITPLQTWTPHRGASVLAVATSDDGRYIATAGGDDSVRLWSAGSVGPSARPAADYGPLSGTITAVAIAETPLGRLAILAGTSRGGVDVLSGAAGDNTIHVTASAVTGVAASADGRHAAVSGGPQAMWLDLSTGAVHPLGGGTTFEPSSSAVTVWGTPDGDETLIATAGAPGVAPPPGSGDPVGPELGDDDPVGAALPADVQLSSDQVGAATLMFPGAGEPIEHLAFMPDGNAVVLAGPAAVMIVPVTRAPVS